jgi:hypothetical protein
MTPHFSCDVTEPRKPSGIQGFRHIRVKALFDFFTHCTQAPGRPLIPRLRFRATLLNLENLGELMYQAGSGGQSGPTPPQKPRAVISRIALLGLIENQGYRCAMTGRQLTPETASLDHKVPLSRGGVHAIENIWIVHDDVNRAKGTMTAEEFVALCREVVSYQEGVQPHGKH